MKNIALLFPGQGSQSLGMGKEIYEKSDFAKECFDIASNSIDIDFKKLLFEDEERLNISKYTQPAILLTSYIIYKLFTKKHQISPKFAIGHSLGEITAITCSGALNLKEAISLVHKRGELMEKACEGKDAGMLAVVGLDDQKCELICKDLQNKGKKIWCANYNVDGQIVLAGNRTDLSSSIELLKESGAKKSILLNMSVASHCEMLGEIVEEFKEVLSSKIKDSFTFPIVSNATTSMYNSKNKAIELLSKQLTEPVRYKQSITSHEQEVDLFLEIGSGGVLKGLNKRITKKETLSINSLESIENFNQKQ